MVKSYGYDDIEIIDATKEHLRCNLFWQSRWRADTIQIALPNTAWCKPNLCTVQIRTFGAPGIRPDARRVSKAIQLVKPCQKVTWHTRHTIRVTWHTRHIIALSQDCSRGLHSYVSAWYIGHSNASTPTKIFGPIDTLCGNLHREHR